MLKGCYYNPFYSDKYQGSKKYIEIRSEPIEFLGFLIYERVSGICFDIVKDGVCCGMYAGINGAKNAIKNIINDTITANRQD